MGESQGRRIGFWLIAGIIAVLITMLGTVIVGVIIVRQAKNEYDEGTVGFYQLKSSIRTGTPIQEGDLAVVKIPKALLPAFHMAVTADDRGRMCIVGKKAPRDLREGEFLFYPDFLRTPLAPDIPSGYELLTIPVSKDNIPPDYGIGEILTIYGDFDVSHDPQKPDHRVLEVMRGVEARSMQGTSDGRRSMRVDSMQILLRSEQVPAMLRIQGLLTTGQFTFTAQGSKWDMPSRGEGPIAPLFSADIVEFLKSRPQPGAKGGN